MDWPRACPECPEVILNSRRSYGRHREKVHGDVKKPRVRHADLPSEELEKLLKAQKRVRNQRYYQKQISSKKVCRLRAIQAVSLTL